MRAPRRPGRRRLPLHVIGAPFDSSGRNAGVARAPGVLRGAALLEHLRAAASEVVDRGDVEMAPTTPERDRDTGLIAPAALSQMIRAVRAAVRKARVEGGFPLVIGGDCPVLLGCLGAWPPEARLGLLFVDGHEDAWPPARSTTGEAADMELGFALGRTTEGLPVELLAELPRVDPGQVVVVGARDSAELRSAGVASLRGEVEMIAPEALAGRGGRSLLGESMARLWRMGPWWLHVDLDVLSSRSLPAVGYPQPGGIDWATLTRLTRSALSSPGLVGWDVTIFDPELDPSGRSARRIVRYLADSIPRARQDEAR